MPEVFELLTKLTGLTLNVKLPVELDETRLLSDFQNVYETFQGTQHSVSHHHDGGWTAIGLVTSGGDVYEDRSIRKVGKPYIPTPALELCPYIKELLDNLPCEKHRVRFMALAPGTKIKWHYDGKDSIDYGRVGRFHIPIITNPNIEFKICSNVCQWVAGNLYYGDFSFPHTVKSNWDKVRVHLVLDLTPNQAIVDLFPESFIQERFKRKILRKLCRQIYTMREAHLLGSMP
ncbi:MAG: aspartyl/asparaginyl beta-hydroxylase domain-containing protein [Moorea sp. SIO1G6]|nr:aspartyl/asparaginyl beta-hydroxylase domain-containing protein [Moorena sp. SIO2B7]NET62933.1 aspartyl/asparaginyl beta-hydroxylase domain-containing protein [Moorena sp. SIO1G6]